MFQQSLPRVRARTGLRPQSFRWVWLDGATSFAVMRDEPRTEPDGTISYGMAIRMDLTPEQTRVPLRVREGLIQGALDALTILLEKTGTAPPRPVTIAGEAT